MEVINGPKRDLKNLIIVHIRGVKDFFGLGFWVVKKCQDTLSKDNSSHLQVSVVLPCVPALNITKETWIGRSMPHRLPENRT